MALQLNMPGTINNGGGKFLDQAGKYHFALIGAEEEPTNSKEQPIDGFRLEFSVLAPEEHKDKKFDLIFWNAKLNDTQEQQQRAAGKQGAAIIALGLATYEQLGQSVTVELADAIDRQGFIELDYRQEKNAEGQWVDYVDDKGRKQIQLAWANIYHVDDPKAKDFPRNEAALNVLPKELRRDPESFKDPSDKGSKAAPAATSTAADDDLGDL